MQIALRRELELVKIPGMHIFKITYPGTNLTDVPEPHTVLMQLNVLESSLADAAVALNFFEQVHTVAPESRPVDSGLPGAPEGYRRRAPFIYAHTVVYSLDAIWKTLGLLARTPGLPSNIGAIYDEYKQALPRLKSVRDSAHHLEDRARRMGRNEEPLNVPVLSISNLFGDKLNYTGADGSQAEIAISPASVAAAQKAIQKTLTSFAWTGSGYDVPHS